MKEISSKDNRIIKNIRMLQQKKHRDETSQFLIEGEHLFLEAKKNKISINTLLVTKDYYEKNKSIISQVSTNTYIVPNNVLESVTDTKTPQGVIAVVAKPEVSFNQLFQNKKSNFLVLDRIQDPGNMGTILRTADASGIDGVILIKGCVDIYSSKVVRSTTGAIFRVPIIIIDNDTEAVELLRKNDKKIVVTSLKASKKYYEQVLTEGIGIVIGNEAEGASDVFHDKADIQVIIPMSKETESLNAGVAASILMYEVLRQQDI